MREIEIKYRKLGKEQANGLAWTEEGVIEIDPRLKGYDHLYTLIHEIIHIQNPKWSEIKVKGHSQQIADILYSEKYRKIEE